MSYQEGMYKNAQLIDQNDSDYDGGDILNNV